MSDGSKRDGPGRPPFAPTEAQRRTVRAMTAYGIPQPDIAAVIDIHPETLRIYFRKEIDVAAAEANAKVAQCLFNKATQDGDTTAMIFWLKARARWSTVDRVLVQETDDVNYDPAGLSDTDLEQRILRLRRAAAAGRIAAPAEGPEQSGGVVH